MICPFCNGELREDYWCRNCGLLDRREVEYAIAKAELRQAIDELKKELAQTPPIPWLLSHPWALYCIGVLWLVAFMILTLRNWP